MEEHQVALSSIGIRCRFDVGDRLIVGITKTYTLASLKTELLACGWSFERAWAESSGSYTLVHASPRIDRSTGSTRD